MSACFASSLMNHNWISKSESTVNSDKTIPAMLVEVIGMGRNAHKKSIGWEKSWYIYLISNRSRHW